MNEQIQMLTQQIDGYEGKLKDLRGKALKFSEAKGLDKAIEKSRAEITTIETDIESIKEELSEKKSKRDKAMAGTLKELSDRMSEVLPIGNAEIRIEDGSLILGLITDKKFRPYAGLSGGEKVSFDAALSYALLADSKEKILVLEAAELDSDNFMKSIKHLSDVDAQVIINSCHFPKDDHKGWNLIKL